MKRLTMTILMLATALTVFAQEREEAPEMKTIFGSSGIRSNGGYGALSTGYTQLDGLDAITMGVRGAWLINHQIGIGLSGYGFITERRFDSELGDDYRLAGGYGGLMLEYIMNPHSPVHLSFPVTIGAGGVAYSEDNFDFYQSDIDFFDEDQSAFFVIEPGVELEMNVLRFMRLAVGVSYRYTSNIDLTYKSTGEAIIDKDALNGLSGGITLKFGKF